ncbi:transcription factor [Datura stramonium]|uniref:Transcription factor n=1 Tax=Datura stramonium TaxID=4076 RepID=A0ABS8TIR6_DATST|nr:transcription factor [Datura stramonium]
MQSTTRDQFEFPAESPKVTALKKCSSETRQNMSCIGLTNTTHGSIRGANIITSSSSDDGYTWRKYGQKTVKGSEFPRSYYKCTQQNCLVKKKVERSPDGQITEIIYKGEHNHHKSQPPRRAVTNSNSYSLAEISKKNIEGNGGSSIWKNMQFGSNKDVRALERTPSAPVLTEVSDSLMLNHQKINMNVFESAETTPEPSSTLASCDDEDEDEDRATEGSTSLGDDVDDNEFEHKKRRREFYSAEVSLLSRTTREPRIVVQIESEIDILDDGYRWRKYGQKVVKGNPNPRSYYKCTSAGCPVRKHVERAPDNQKSVITTYEGKHNHEVPSANKTNGIAAAAGNQVSASTINGQSSILVSPKSHKVSNPEIQVQDFNFQFERKPFDYVRPNFLESHLSDLRCSPLYDLRFPPNLQSPLSYNNFLLSPTKISSSRPFTPFHMPDFPLPSSLPLSFPVGPNIVPPLSGFHYNDLTLTPNGVSSHSSPAVRDQNHIHMKNKNNNNNYKNSRLLKANEEMKNENLYDHQNGASSTVMCGHIMDNFTS